MHESGVVEIVSQRRGWWMPSNVGNRRAIVSAVDDDHPQRIKACIAGRRTPLYVPETDHNLFRVVRLSMCCSCPAK